MKIAVAIEFDSFEEFIAHFRDQPPPKAKTRVAESLLTARTKLCLEAAGIEFVEDAQAMDDRQLLSVPNLGRKSMQEVRDWRPPQSATEQPRA